MATITKNLLYVLACSILLFSCKNDESDTPAPSLVISSFTPGEGQPYGANVTITGVSFSATASENEVRFNGAIANVGTASTTQLTVQVPPGATTGKISVKVGDQTAYSQTDFLVPTITSLEPASAAAGATVVINGSALVTGPGNEVTFMGIKAEILEASSTQIKVIVPINAPSGNITVNTGNSTVATTGFTIKPWVHVSTYVDGTTGTTDQKFTNLYGLSIVSSDGLIATDRSNAVVRRFYPGGTREIVAGSTPGYHDGDALTAQFYGLGGVASSLFGDLYIASGTSVRTMVQSTVFTLAGNGSTGYVDAKGTDARFTQATAIALHPSLDLVVSDEDKIRMVTLEGVVTTLAGSSQGFENGTGTAAKFNGVSGLAFDKTGNVYVADYGNNVIRKITQDGVTTTFAGTGTAGTQDGPLATALFDHPVGIAINRDGYMYVIEWPSSGSKSLRMITPEGRVITLTGRLIDSDNPTQIYGALFSTPTSITVDLNNNIFVADGPKIMKVVFQ
ncbi:NHL repeat-containing protein [Chryseolinea serpens]|uniref:NHL repeat-containing protein n=1 Tax=Chryseolinea serpens TaxID=947013 RepID=A0A1M5JN20_9BACT|nr:IPT/TIG domain-containing protein [Chryseolinea serpens]SHG41639.1 NHL repeat-containing protein [Chryseolinea serpens]